MKSLNAKIDALERRRGWLPPKEAREMRKATDAALASLEEDEVDASGFQGWTLEAWLGSIDLAAIFSDALLHHFASGALTKEDEGRQLTIRTVRLERPAPLSAPPGGDMVEHLETRVYVDGKPRAVTWPGAPPADGSWRIEEVEQRASDGGFPRAVVNGKVHLLAPGNPIPYPDPAPDPDSYP